MRILYIGGFELPDKNAAAQRVVANALALRELGHEVQFIGTTKESNFGGEFNSFKFQAVPYPKYLRGWIKHLTEFAPLEWVNIYNPDVIIAYNYPAWALYRLYKFCKKNHIKLIGDITEWYVEEGFNIRSILKRIDTFVRMRLLNKRMDGLITISDYLYTFYKDYTPTVKIPPLVDISSNKWSINSNIEKDSSSIKLIFAGTIGSSKDQLLPIIENIKYFDNLTLTIIGISETDFKRHSNVIIPTNVSFKGRISHTEVIALLKSNDFQIFVRENNLANKAGFPTKYVESSATSIPVITTRTSDLEQYIIPGINGYFIDDNNSIHDILKLVSTLNKIEIRKMKNYIKSSFCFDYHTYLQDFDNLLNQSH